MKVMWEMRREGAEDVAEVVILSWEYREDVRDVGVKNHELT